MTTEEGARIIEQGRRIEELEKQLKNSVQVVRCGDCKWSEDAGWFCTYYKENGMLECRCPHIEEISDPYEGSIKVYKPTDFCSYGERSK